MNFEFTEEQVMLRKMVRSFVDKEIMPNIGEWDENQQFNQNILKRLAELNLMGVCIPEAYGGSGMDYNSLAIVCEELERGDTAFRTAVSVHIGLNSLTLLQFGTETQKQKYLVPQAKGEKIGAFGLTEPGAGSDVASLATTAVKDGDDYILNGSKTWISLCDYADNFIVFAYTDKDKRHNGISAFIVERTMPGFSSHAIKGKLGIRAGNTGELSLTKYEFQKKICLVKKGKDLKSQCLL